MVVPGGGGVGRVSVRVIFHDAPGGKKKRKKLDTIKCVGNDLFPLFTHRGESVLQCGGVVGGFCERESRERY